MARETDKFSLTDDQWKERLSAERYRVLREKGTEQAFLGALYRNVEEGVYLCAGCGLALFSSDSKYDSGSGWPSFSSPIEQGAVANQYDYSMHRKEAMCSRCGGHLGHVFPDGPEPTGLRYCMNSLSLEFRKKGV